jgi:hypothetical protein
VGGARQFALLKPGVATGCRGDDQPTLFVLKSSIKNLRISQKEYQNKGLSLTLNARWPPRPNCCWPPFPILGLDFFFTRRTTDTEQRV